MKIKIKSWWWTINFVKENEIPNPREGHRYLGLTENIELRIWINNEMPDDLIGFAVKHELTHAYMFSYGLEQVDMTFELVCDFVATYGEQIIMDTRKILNDKRYNDSVEKGDKST